MTGVTLLCGMDEAGRGPLAGPVSAAAVVLPFGFPVELLNDSKKLSGKKRLALERLIKERSCWAVALVGHDVIDRINILQASLLAMRNAFTEMLGKLDGYCRDELELDVRPPLTALADGSFCPDVPVPCSARPRADATVPEVMAASILAKTERDRVMAAYALQYPEYGYERHKGYPTREHMEICRRIGPSPIQRMSFRF